ncbi:hypothetical protein K7432_000695 [Basidiobolus ranarum]|uniref:Secreted protein n=1 Tax=Basidiobolus ranarum TaxID=34480 RepID=A0ABR2X447_9FUNG
MYIQSNIIFALCCFLGSFSLVAGRPVPQEASASVTKHNKSHTGTWKQKLDHAVDYKPGDEYEENDFEDYADDYSFLLPDGSEPTQSQGSE